MKTKNLRKITSLFIVVFFLSVTHSFSSGCYEYDEKLSDLDIRLEFNSVLSEDSTTLKQNLLEIVEKQNGVVFQRKEIGIINGRKLMAEIIEPEKPSSGKRPAIVFLHGGGYAKGKPEDLRAQAAFFALEYNCYTLSVDYSLTAEARLWPQPVLEASYAMRWVRSIAEENNIDPNQIVLSGGSAGGHLSAIVAVNSQTKRYPAIGGLDSFSSRPDVMVIFNGYFDLVKYPLNRQIQQMIGSEDSKKVDATSKELSTVYQVDNNFPPLLQMIGTKDPFLKQSLEFHEKLQSLDMHSEIETYKDKGHAFFNNEPSFGITLKRMEKFLIGQLNLQSKN